MIKHRKPTVEHRLQKTAQLRALTVSLRRAHEAATNERLLGGFNAFWQRKLWLEEDPNSVPMPSEAALLRGIKTFWVQGDYDSILRLAGLLSQEILDKERLLQAYVMAAAHVRT